MLHHLFDVLVPPFFRSAASSSQLLFQIFFCEPGHLEKFVTVFLCRERIGVVNGLDLIDLILFSQRLDEAGSLFFRRNGGFEVFDGFFSHHMKVVTHGFLQSFVLDALSPCLEVTQFRLVHVDGLIYRFQFSLRGPCVDLAFCGNHTIEDVFDLGCEFYVPQILCCLVDVDQPFLEPSEDPLHFFGGCAAVHEVFLEAPGKAFLHPAFHGTGLPCSDVFGILGEFLL